jgi:hypothetical protein
MRQNGYKLVQVWMDAKEWQAFKTLQNELAARGATLLRRLMCEAAGIPFQGR